MTNETALTPTTKALLADPGKAATTLLAKWPKDLVGPAAREFAIVAWTYDLDPFIGDIVPYMGRPFVTLQGWERLVGRHAPGQLIGYEARQATPEEREEIRCPAEDYLAIGTVIRKHPMAEKPLIVKHRGRVTAAEWKGLKIEEGRRGYTPVEKEPYEMAETRARRRALRTAFRDVLDAHGPKVDLETGEIIEGTVVECKDAPALPDAASGPVDTPPGLMSEATKRARAELYSKASEAKIISRGELHAILELPCKGEPPEKHTDLDGPDECHALRQGIDAMIDEVSSEAEAWEKMTQKLVSNIQPRAEAPAPPKPEPQPPAEAPAVSTDTPAPSPADAPDEGPTWEEKPGGIDSTGAPPPEAE